MSFYIEERIDNESVDSLVPDPQVWRELGISSMTGWRWTHDASLNFPPAIKIRNRCFRSRRMLEEFKSRMLRQAIAERDGPEHA
jgi:predicted DNA-binding transcriptional regulator AlpA